MKINFKGDGQMASWDRALRIIVGIALVYITVWHVLPASWYPYAYILTLLGLLNIVFSIVGWCPPYALFGFSSCRIKDRKGD